MNPPIRSRKGCDADAETKLINRGMDLTKRSSFYNETVLHRWAGGHNCCNTFRVDWSAHQDCSLRVVKLLVEKGADLLDLNSWGFTPLLKAANGSDRHEELPNLMVLDFLLERKEYSRAEKIEAMELAGAVILQNTKNASLFPKAFNYWRKTLHLRRQMEEDDFGFIEKPRLNLKNVKTTEWNTSAELKKVMKHPDQFLIQSFLVRLRIFSSKNWFSIESLFNSTIIHVFDCERLRRFSKVIDIVWAMIDTLLSRSDLRENVDVQRKIGCVLGGLIELWSFLARGSSKILTGENIKTSLNVIISASGFVFLVNDHRYVSRFLRILSLLPQLLLKKDITETLSNVRDQHGRNLLHMTIFDNALIHANLYAIVCFLLYAGCDPNAVDQDGNASLHLLAELHKLFGYPRLNIIAVLLLDFGARLDLKNADGKTAVDLLIRMNEKNIGWNLPDWCTEVPTLASLSAIVIRRNRIPHLKLPASLISLIDKHKSTQ